MTKLLKPFDATKVDPAQGGSQLPVGRHKVVVSDGDITSTKANDGGLLVLHLTVIEGPAQGVTGDYRLNLYNKSEQAVEIAERKLSAVCHVTGVFQLQDVRQLANIPFWVDVQKQPNNDKYTEIVKVYDINGNEPGKQDAPAPAPAGGGWGAPADSAPAGGGWGAPADSAPAGGGWGAPASGGNTPSWAR